MASDIKFKATEPRLHLQAVVLHASSMCWDKPVTRAALPCIFTNSLNVLLHFWMPSICRRIHDVQRVLRILVLVFFVAEYCAPRIWCLT